MPTPGAILPDIPYQNGFLIDGRVVPFFSFSQPGQNVHWSEEMSHFISETTQDHFIDRYNRDIACRALAPSLRTPDANYIDIGCGPGYLLQEVASACPDANIYGSDYIAESLVQCHRLLPKIPLFQWDITERKLPDDFFDAISCLNVLEHITDDVAALREIRRVLKPGGRAAITVPAGPSLYDLNDEIHFHVRRYTMPDLLAKCRGAGLTVLRHNYFGVAIYPAFWFRKKMNQWLYGQRTRSEKQRIALSQAKGTQSIPWLGPLCRLEYRLGQWLSFPAGVRAYVVAQKGAEG